MMSYEFHVSIVATGEVTDSVSANLYSVTMDEMLDERRKQYGNEAQDG